MKRWTSTWTAMLVVGFLAVPGIGLAQTSPAAAPSATSSATAQDKSAQGTPQEHLQEADAALNSISPTAVSGKAKSQIADLKKHVNSLQKMTASTSADTSANAANATSAAKWSTEAAAADKIFGELLSATPATGDAAASVTAEPKPTGTSGTTAPKASAHANDVALDDETKAKLTAARASLTAFAAAMSGTARAGGSGHGVPGGGIRCGACDGGAGRGFCFGTDGITHAIVAGTVTGVPGNACHATAGRHAGAAARNAVNAPGRAHAVDPAFSNTSAAAGDAANRADEPGAASGEHHSATGGANGAGQRKSGCGQAGVDSRTRLAGADDTVAGGTGADWRTARPGVTAHLELQRADHDEQRVEGLLRQGGGKPERAPRLAGT